MHTDYKVSVIECASFDDDFFAMLASVMPERKCYIKIVQVVTKEEELCANMPPERHKRRKRFR